MILLRSVFVFVVFVWSGTRAEAGVWGFHSEAAYETFQQGIEASIPC